MVLRIVFLLFVCISTFVASQRYIEYPHDTCKVGDVIENECNRCVCNTKYVYECEDKPCKVSEQKTDVEYHQMKCQPKMVYVRQDIVCICNKYGKWPHPKCVKALQILHKNKTSMFSRCEPNSYVKVDCNICRCNSRGEVDRDYCTKNNCTEIYVKTSRKALPLPRSVHGHCEPKNWYSLAPCQFCFCVNTNKLVCNTADFYVNKLQLGKYNLNICGKDLIKEAIELIPGEMNNLRHGFEARKTTTSTTTTTTTTTPVPVTHVSPKITAKSNPINNIPMIVREVITHKKQEGEEGSTEYYDTEDTKPAVHKLNLDMSEGSGDRAFEENENKVDNRNDEYEDEEDTVDDTQSKYANVKPGVVKPAINVDKIIINVDKANKSAHTQSKTLRERDLEDNYVLDVFVPNVLESIFNMQLRKSMLKVDTNSDCFPGTKETVDCNTCFCLNNGKKLCTTNVCQ